MKKHKYNILPEAQPDELAELIADMTAHGYDAKQPITVYQGDILDGWNRHCAAVAAGVSPTIVTFTGTDADAVFFVLRMGKRRNLNSGQRAAVATEAEDLLKVIADAVAKEKARNNSDERRTRGKVEVTQLIESPKKNKRSTEAKAAEMFGTNRTYINQAAKLKATSPETLAKVKAGTVTMTQALREIKEAKREARREENRAKVAMVESPADVAESGAKFSTIVIDPPWDWGDEGDNDQLGRAKADYATMSFSQLMDLPVEPLADDDCHLYLWITNRSLPKGFSLMEKWGFRYVTALTWVKPHFGMGNYFRGQTEHVLFGVRGSQPLKRKDVGTVFSASRGPNGHSSKPVEFYDLVESCSPGPYLEMFSRSDRQDWQTWGEGA